MRGGQDGICNRTHIHPHPYAHTQARTHAYAYTRVPRTPTINKFINAHTHAMRRIMRTQARTHIHARNSRNRLREEDKMRFAITFTDMTEQEVEAPSMLTKRESFHYAIDEAVKTCVQLHKEIDSIELVEK